MTKKRIPFLCTGNSARRQMAEATLRNHSGDKYEVVSAELVRKVETTAECPNCRQDINEKSLVELKSEARL